MTDKENDIVKSFDNYMLDINTYDNGNYKKLNKISNIGIGNYINISITIGDKNEKEQVQLFIETINDIKYEFRDFVKNNQGRERNILLANLLLIISKHFEKKFQSPIQELENEVKKLLNNDESSISSVGSVVSLDSLSGRTFTSEASENSNITVSIGNTTHGGYKKRQRKTFKRKSKKNKTKRR